MRLAVYPLPFTLYPSLFLLHRRVPSHLEERGFGSAIREEVWLSNEARNRAQVDDGPAVLLQVFNGVLRDHRGADDVCPERLLPLFDGRREAFEHECRSVVDK